MRMSEQENKGRVPVLRFPEFRDEGEWDIELLGNNKIAELAKERVALDQLRLQSYVSTENLLPDYGGVTAASKLPPSGSFTRYKKGDVLVSNIRPYLKKVWVSDREGASSNDVVVIRAGEKINSKFLAFALKNDGFINYVMRGAKGVKMPRGDISSMKDYPVAFPKDGEQQKIADCLTSIDELITVQTQKLGALKIYKKGLMQQLFPAEGETAPKLRFPEFRDKGEWSNRMLGDFIAERCQFPEGKVPLYSLTLEDGIAPKTERYERSFLVKNEEEAYKLVQHDDFAYNPMNLRFGAIARHAGQENVAVSKYYNIFYCNESVDPRFCEIYFRSQRMISYYDDVATGSLIEKRRVHFSDFLKFDILFPPLKEQQKIADCLTSIDELIIAQAQKHEALKAHKKGLMQQLFPSVGGVAGEA